MKFKLYKSSQALLTVFKGKDDYYHCGEAFIEGGVRPHLFFTKEGLFKFIKGNGYKRTHLK